MAAVLQWIALFIVLAALLVGVWVMSAWRRTKQELARMLTVWGTKTSPWCTTAADDGEPVCQALHDPAVLSVDEIPTANSGVPTRLMYGIKAIAHFVRNGTVHAADDNATQVTLIPDVTASPPLAAVCVSADGTSALVVIRGTMTASDLLADVKFNAVPIPGQDGCTAHSGIWKLYADALQSQVAGALPETVTDVFICGHSLGGALAHLVGFGLLSANNNGGQSRRRRVGIVAVAPPRVLNPVAAALSQKNAAFVNTMINLADPVPTLPFTFMPRKTSDGLPPSNYVHVGEIAVIHKPTTDLISCHLLPAYASGAAGAQVVAAARGT